ncbi:MAG: tRNA pseudouridine(55) synthase TruB [Gammaproteobacteria bacterium]|nr:tRNA pseudouridine(55) synthase TruB [Gammaproteobacteria bacterium]MCP5137916.1 tRNA pseudouridine(55) synthase TruB [Gammaproteobacteria bacterium]
MSRRHRFRGRQVNGVLLFDKPIGMSSNDALQKVKRLFKAAKAGHTGSLDPLATGLLPLCFGHATKMSAFLLDADKRYVVRCKLGQRTRTADAEGEVIETRPVPALDAVKMDAVLAPFRGPIEQVPPMYSALKHEGERLYKLARKGIEVEREPRQVTIHALTLTALSGDEMELDVHCSKGTYVRTLVEDIGEALGCGAHVIALRRTQVGPFDGSVMYTVEAMTERLEENEGDLKSLDALLLPLDSTVSDWPAVRLTPDSAFYVRQGQPVLVPKAPTKGMVRLYQNDDEFIGVGEILDDGRVAPRRMFLED